jgi:hypothetical protein
MPERHFKSDRFNRDPDYSEYNPDKLCSTDQELLVSRYMVGLDPGQIPNEEAVEARETIMKVLRKFQLAEKGNPRSLLLLGRGSEWSVCIERSKEKEFTTALEQLQLLGLKYGKISR